MMPYLQAIVELNMSLKCQIETCWYAYLANLAWCHPLVIVNHIASIFDVQVVDRAWPRCMFCSSACMQSRD